MLSSDHFITNGAYMYMYLFLFYFYFHVLNLTQGESTSGEISFKIIIGQFGTCNKYLPFDKDYNRMQVHLNWT